MITILLYVCLFIGLATNQKHFADKGDPSVSVAISEFFDANEQFEENNEEMKKNQKGKAIVEMIMSPKFSKIVGQKEKHIKSQTQEDEQNVENERIKQHIASSSNSVEKGHEESIIRNYIKKIHAIISSKYSSNNKIQRIVEQSDVDETLNSPKNQREFLNAHEHSDKNKAKVPDDCLECPICYEFVMYDQFCFCDHLMNDAIFGSSSNNAQKESHAFCRECLQGYTKAALETKPFARGWLGLKCMAEKCENPIPWQELKSVLPDELEAIETLESHCAELCVSAACLCLERCPKCNCAVELDCPLPTDYENDSINENSDGIKEENIYSLLKLLKSILRAICPLLLNDTNNEKLKFHCPECHYEMCRKCNEKWTEEHNNLTCKQFAKKQQNDQNQRNLRDNQLSKNVVNRFTKCPECKSPVEKISGCDHMACPCGADFLYCCGNKYNTGLGGMSKQKHALLCRRKE